MPRRWIRLRIRCESGARALRSDSFCRTAALAPRIWWFRLMQRRRICKEDDVALLTALCATALLMGLGVSLLLLGTGEAVLGAHARDATAASYAASGAAAIGVAELRRLTSWSGVVAP